MRRYGLYARRWPTRCISAIGALLVAFPARAQSTEMAIEQAQLELERKMAEIVRIQREAQQNIEALQRETEAKLKTLHDEIDRLSAQAQTGESVPAQRVEALPEASSERSIFDRLAFSGDFRLRYESNSSHGDTPSSDRSVLRGRLAAHYTLDESWSLGARMVTGDSKNPRTSDVTLGDFASDLELSLDQAYVAFRHGNLFLTGGKFAKPFQSTELVWDGDVNPQGLGGYYDLVDRGGLAARISGIYFIVDDPALVQSSDMWGGQITLGVQAFSDWHLSLSTAYYDYDIGILDLPGSNGARGNNVTADGDFFVSDFDLLDVIATVDYAGLGDRWHVKLVADFAKNLGARVPEDTAWGADLFLGSLAKPGSFLFRYGYAQVETDAVLGLFSNDNIPLATNYKLHTVSVDYALAAHTYLGLTQYFFSGLDTVPGRPSLADDWASRTRLNLYFQF